MMKLPLLLILAICCCCFAPSRCYGKLLAGDRAADAADAVTPERWSVGLEAAPEDQSLWRRLADLYQRRTSVDADVATPAVVPAPADLPADPVLLQHQGGGGSGGGGGGGGATHVDAASIPANYFDLSARLEGGGGGDEPFDKTLGIGSEVQPGVDRAEALATCQPPWCYPAECTNCPGRLDCPPGTEAQRKPDGSGYHCVATPSQCVPPCRNGGTCANGKCACPVGFTGDYCQAVNVAQCRALTGQLCNYGCRRVGSVFRCLCPPWITTPPGGSSSDSCVPVDPDGGGDSGEPCPAPCLNGACRGGVCVCRPGWRGDQCSRDVDECASDLTNRCEYKCRNTIGSHRCLCPPGYRLNETDGFRCSLLVCPPGCGGGGRGRCVDGRCDCRPGWTGTDCQKDVDECAAPSGGSGGGVCQGGCVNTAGSYRCLCPPGQRLGEDGSSCSPADRCEPACGPETGACVNGSCVCRAGWTGADCRRDKDECALGFHACQGGCANTAGSYRCLCPPGQRLGQDGRACEPDNSGGSTGSYRCSQSRPCQNGGTCSADNNGVCACRPGFYGDFCQKPVDGGCQPAACRSGGGACVDGRCVCPPGRTGPRCERLAEESDCSPACRHGRCVRSVCVCDVGYEGAACDSRFVCMGSADCDRGWCGSDGRCVCLLGWRGSRCDVDANECDLSPAPCEHSCYNEPGSYRCICDPGFEVGPNGTCGWAGDPSCPSGCRNGGRCHAGRCRCPPGYRGARCSADVDECGLGRGVHGCEFACYNTHGGWECRCPPGYTRLADRRTCRRSPPDTRCRPACLNGGACSSGGTVCACQRGFAGLDCGQDVDECQLYRPCQHQCVNTVGSYACRCPPGLLLRYDGIRCITKEEARERPDLLYRGNGVKGHVINGTTTEAAPIMPTAPPP